MANKFKPMHRRLIFIDQEVRNGTRIGKLPNCRTLAAQWEVSAKTIQRDVDYLKWEMDAPIEYDAVKHGYYYTEPNWRMPAIRIKQTDLFAICIAEKVLTQYRNTPVHDNLVSVFERLGKAMPDEVNIDPGWLNDRFTFFPEPAPEIDPTVWKSVFQGLRDSRTLKFDYLNPGYCKTYKRTVRPYHAISFKAEWYLLGHCEYMKSLRIFAMSRISKVKVTDDYFFVPDEFDFKKLAGTHFGIMFGKEEYDVKIRFNSAAAPYAKERQWHPTQQIEDQADGSTILTFTTNHLLEVKRWVLSWGADALVLGPPELVDPVKQELARSLAGYQ